MAFIKSILWKCIKAFCYILYPFVVIYYHFLKNGIDEMLGQYCLNQIRKHGKGVKIRGIGTFTEGDKIGDYTKIGKNAYFHSSGGLEIGRNVQMSRNVTIYTANHNYKSSTFIPYDNTEIMERVVICDNVWIGMNVSILPGVTVGKNSIIGMNAVISKDVPENAIVVGFNRIIGYRELKTQTKLFGKEFN